MDKCYFCARKSTLLPAQKLSICRFNAFFNEENWLFAKKLKHFLSQRSRISHASLSACMPLLGPEDPISHCPMLFLTTQNWLFDNLHSGKLPRSHVGTLLLLLEHSKRVPGLFRQCHQCTPLPCPTEQMQGGEQGLFQRSVPGVPWISHATRGNAPPSPADKLVNSILGGLNLKRFQSWQCTKWGNPSLCKGWGTSPCSLNCLIEPQQGSSHKRQAPASYSDLDLCGVAGRGAVAWTLQGSLGRFQVWQSEMLAEKIV